MSERGWAVLLDHRGPTAPRTLGLGARSIAPDLLLVMTESCRKLGVGWAEEKSRRYDQPLDVTVYQPPIWMMGKDCQQRLWGLCPKIKRFDARRDNQSLRTNWASHMDPTLRR